MKQKHLYSLLDTSFVTIGVVFPDAPARAQEKARLSNEAPWRQTPAEQVQGSAYTYKAPKDAGVAVDDFVVVLTNNKGLCVARVVRVDETPQIDIDADHDYKWIVQRIDRDGYDARVKAERLFADTMLEIERTRQRELMVDGFRNTLPENSAARALFEKTVASIGTTVEHKA